METQTHCFGVDILLWLSTAQSSGKKKYKKDEQIYVTFSFTAIAKIPVEKTL